MNRAKRNPQLGKGCSFPRNHSSVGLPSSFAPSGGTLHLIQQTESLRTANPPRMRIENLKKVFRTGKQELVLFENLSFQVHTGEMLAIVGESGSGKSTLLHILGALDRPSAGEVFFGETPLRTLSEEAAADFRGREIGFVWQFHYLLPEFTALENVAMPLLMRRNASPMKIALEKAAGWLKEVGLLDRADHRPVNFPAESSSESL